MLKKTIEYTDFNGVKQVEDLYFHLTETEMIRLETADYPLSARLQELNKPTPDKKKIVELFENLIQVGFGIKSDDGKRFTKNAQITEEFMATEAYNSLFLNLLVDPENAIEFINGLIPDTLMDRIKTELKDPNDPEAVRKASEALMQGYKQKQPTEPKVVEGEDLYRSPANTPSVTEMTEEQKAELRRQLGM